MIMLIGIVEKNAIMQIDFTLEAERGGKTPEAAIYEGCLIRFRPIMMTTMAALLGAVPIAIGYGAGGGARQPLGLVVVGGLLFSQLVTLYLTPVVYTYVAQVQTWMKSRQQTQLKPVIVGKTSPPPSQDSTSVPSIWDGGEDNWRHVPCTIERRWVHDLLSHW